MRYWRKHEDAKLTRLCKAGKSGGDIAVLMKLTRGQVMGRKYRLGLCDPEKNYKPAGPRGRNYTPDEIATLERMTSYRLGPKTIARELKRSVTAVLKKLESIRAKSPGKLPTYRLAVKRGESHD